MAELLVRIVDRGGVDLPKGPGDSKRGDVIAACPDGWGWSIAERTDPQWRLMRVPLLGSEITALLAPGDGDPLTQKIHRRKYYVDINKIVDIEPGFLDYPRVPSIPDLTAKVKKVRAAMTLKGLA
jgi:hypothetical protein